MGDKDGDILKLFMRNQSRAMVPKLVVKSGNHLLNWESQEGLHSSLLHSLVGDEMRNMNRVEAKLSHGGIHVVETVVCLPWMTVVSTLGIRACHTLMFS